MKERERERQRERERVKEEGKTCICIVNEKILSSIGVLLIKEEIRNSQ